jgi:hypothetical protein
MNVPLKWQYKLLVKAFKTITLLDSLHVIESSDKADAKIKDWCGTNPKFIDHLHTWGKAGTVNFKNKGTPKIADCGI